MAEQNRLTPDQLYTYCDLESLDFETTKDIEEHQRIVGQDRVVSSIQFGVSMDRDGYNIFALGPNETGKKELIEDYLKKHSSEEEVPHDMCYVNNFEEEYKPEILMLPAGRGSDLRDSMNKLIEDLDTTLTAAFESEEYQNRRQAIEEDVQQEQGESISDLQQRAQEEGLALIRTPAGFSFAPMQEGEIMSQEEVQELSDEEEERLEEKVEEFQKELQQVLRKVPSRKREVRERIRKLDREIASYAVKDLIDELKQKFSNLSDVVDFLDAVHQDIVDNVKSIISQQGQNQLMQMMQAQGGGNGRGSSSQEDPTLRRYKVNVLVDNSETEGAPVVYEDNPTFKNLVGRVEYKSQMGALTTDFNLIKPGALHMANGGYLILDARRVLMEPFAWEGLKRTLKSQKLKIESPGESYGLISTVSLEPKPLDLDVKVVLLGERLLYYLLCQYDPEFRSLFKVEADFDDDIDRNEENQEKYAQLLAGLAGENELKPFDKSAVARIIERSARMVEDSEKMSTRNKQIENLMQEADYWSRENGNENVTREDVQKAIEQRLYRSSRIRDKIQEAIQRDTLYIDTSGEEIGQINGLSVAMIGDVMFGRPNRITASVRLGKGEVVNIEREVKMSGPIHSKGVMILSGFLGQRFGTRQPLSLSASLVFEQSYSGVDGDSASAAELYALMSAIGQIPINQSYAITGSINQRGQIQPIGGVNQKIEGFFDVCKKRGLTGEQGVLIPKTNVKNLMLREDVIEAVKEEKFQIYAIETVDEGMEILTGLEMGERDENEEFPEGTINYKVEKRLSEMTEKRKHFASNSKGESESKNDE